MPRWRRQIFGVGAVPPSEPQQQCVVFVCGKNPDGQIVPVGTAFLIGVPDGLGAWDTFFVTAAHVVRGGDPRWIRVRRRDGGEPEDKQTDEWFLHPESDVALTPCGFETSGYIANFQEEAFFADKHPPGVTVQVGAPVYFMGLLSNVEDLSKRAIPMMRPGNVGALDVENIQVLDKRQGFSTYVHAEPMSHLIDCNARRGFSGAPVYVEYPVVNVSLQTAQPAPTLRLESSIQSITALLGVLVGHLNDDGDNAGVAIVVPIKALRDLLEDPRVEDWRQNKMAARARNKDEETRG